MYVKPLSCVNRKWLSLPPVSIEPGQTPISISHLNTPKMIVESSKNIRWIIPFKKFGIIRAKNLLNTLTCYACYTGALWVSLLLRPKNIWKMSYYLTIMFILILCFTSDILTKKKMYRTNYAITCSCINWIKYFVRQ